MNFKYLSCIFNVNVWVILLGIDLSFIGAFINKYIFSDMGYLKWLVIAMIIDLITGITKVWVTQGWSCITSKGLRDTVAKCVQYGGFLIITHVLTHFEINGQVQISGMSWLNKLAYEFLILIECKSVYENIVRINPKLDFVKMVLEKVSGYLKNKDNNEK